MNASDNKNKPDHFSGLVWWITLIMAVVAVPIVGTSVALAATDSAFLQMVVFVLTCWACTWLGMWLMKKADAHQKKLGK